MDHDSSPEPTQGRVIWDTETRCYAVVALLLDALGIIF